MSAEFIEMDGHGLYVWGAYVLTAAAMGGELFLLWKRGRRTRHLRGDGDSYERTS